MHSFKMLLVVCNTLQAPKSFIPINFNLTYDTNHEPEGGATTMTVPPEVCAPRY